MAQICPYLMQVAVNMPLLPRFLEEKSLELFNMAIEDAVDQGEWEFIEHDKNESDYDKIQRGNVNYYMKALVEFMICKEEGCGKYNSCHNIKGE